MSIILYDSFFDSDSTALSSHTPDIYFAATWAHFPGAWDIQDNQANCLITNRPAVNNTNVTSYTIKAKLRASDGFDAQYILFRADSGGTNYLVFKLNAVAATRAQIWDSSSNLKTTAPFYNSSPSSGWWEIDIVVTSTAVTVYGKDLINGVEEWRQLLTYATTQYSTNTYVGIKGNIVGARITDFVVSTTRITPYEYSPNEKAKFYKKNFIDNTLDGYTLSGDFSDSALVGDRRIDTYAIASLGLAEFVVTFSTEQDLTMLGIRSNIEMFKFQYWSGGGWVNFVPEALFFTERDFLIFEFSELTTEKIKLIAYTTFVPGDNKRIFELITTRFFAEMNFAENTTVIKIPNYKITRTIAGGSVVVNPYPNDDKLELSFRITNWESENYTAYKAIKHQMKLDSFLLYCFLSENIEYLMSDALYLVNEEENYEHSPSNKTLVNGIDGQLKFKEV